MLNSIKLPLGSIFHTTCSFVKKLTPVKTLGEKVLLIIEHFFFKIWNYAMEWCHQQRMFFKLASVKSVKTAALFSFFIISNIMVKTFIESER